MKKNFLTKIITLTMAFTLALTPVTASAAEKRVITHSDFEDINYTYFNEDERTFDNAGWMKEVASMNGAYQKNGLKIYTVLNGATKTFKKAGSYSIVVGGKNAKKDEGTVKFVAPKTGTYKVTLDASKNVAGGSLCIAQYGSKQVPFKVNYKNNNGRKTSSFALISSDGSGAYKPKSGSLGDYATKHTFSEMKKVSGSIKLKKGQSLTFVARSSSADETETEACAYNFVGYDMTIRFVK